MKYRTGVVNSGVACNCRAVSRAGLLWGDRPLPEVEP